MTPVGGRAAEALAGFHTMDLVDELHRRVKLRTTAGKGDICLTVVAAEDLVDALAQFASAVMQAEELMKVVRDAHW